MNEELLWKKVIDFHGHVCGGIAIGFKAALYAIELLGLEAAGNDGTCISEDEEVVCIAENDACGVDAVQVILGCTLGKGNLLLRIRGKQAFDFYDRRTGKSVRLILKEFEGTEKKKYLEILMNKTPAECFDVTPVRFELPEPARHFASVKCSRCGEMTADHLIRLDGDEKLCLDCFEEYKRFE